VVNFSKEYQKHYGTRRYPMPGAIEQGREVLRRYTDPGSAEAYRQAQMTARPLPPGVAVPDEWVKALEAAGGFVFFDSRQAPVAGFAPALRESLRRTGFVNAYAQAGGRDIELMLYREPHSAPAPDDVMFPLRGRSWPWLGAALAAYLALGWPRRMSVRVDPVALGVLDLATALSAAFFFGLPLRACASTQAALDDPLGGLVWSWLVAAALALALRALARRAAFGITLVETGLVLHGMGPARQIDYAAITAVTVHEETGLDLRLADGETVRLDWTGLVNFSSVAQALRRVTS
jgi:hypothetical protein